MTQKLDVQRLMEAIFGEWSDALPNEEVVRKVLGSLLPREEVVIRLRFAIPKWTLRSIASYVPRHDGGQGVSFARVGQIKQRALRRLRHPSRSFLLRGKQYTSPEEKKYQMEQEKAKALHELFYEAGRLGLPPRISNALARDGYRTFIAVREDLDAIVSGRIKLRNVGAKGLARLKAALDGKGNP